MGNNARPLITVAHTRIYQKTKFQTRNLIVSVLDMPSFNICGYWITFEFNTLNYDYDLGLLLLHYVFFKRKFQALFDPLPPKENGSTVVQVQIYPL